VKHRDADYALREACTARREAASRVRTLLARRPPAADLEDALLLATELGHEDHVLEIVRILLDAGADPNARRADALPLLFAVARGDGALAGELLARGADPDMSIDEPNETFELKSGTTPRKAALGTALEPLFFGGLRLSALAGG
jgi:hypothetical protein